jgi:hypothetical protein
VPSSVADFSSLFQSSCSVLIFGAFECPGLLSESSVWYGLLSPRILSGAGCWEPISIND